MSISINGINVTAQFSALCGPIWLLVYIGIVYLVIRFRPNTIKTRRWKASLLVAGLPVLGMPILFGLISMVLIVTGDSAKLSFSQFMSKAFISFTGFLIGLSPFSLLLSIFATTGTYSRMKMSSDWLNRIVPPDKDERTSIHEWN